MVLNQICFQNHLLTSRKQNQWRSVTFMHFQVLALLEVEKWSQRQINEKLYLITILKKNSRSISAKTNTFTISFYYIQNLCSSPMKLKGFGGLISTIDFLWKYQIFVLVNTWKFQKPGNFWFLLPKVFHRKGLKNGWKKFTGKFWACASGRTQLISFLMALLS